MSEYTNYNIYAQSLLSQYTPINTAIVRFDLVRAFINSKQANKQTTLNKLKGKAIPNRLADKQTDPIWKP